ncbi:hypothetical protein J31TS6_57450 [Brevibacillus reuszeri]|uniref:hypothetical protein n=1 Tax=Brevibacillus reuszeri TaxID=54915 RepID=UPI001B1D4AB6|nr:hypothetical protein [Brevibacillus reuszeri]GIO09717.1 hypothetical protein J31TS6_57450 [Brevibacillus reuszeri]
MSGKRIENDEQLQNSLNWLLEKAKELDHPLMEGAAREALMAKYDFVSEKVEEYRREQTLRAFPHLQDNTQKENVVEQEKERTEPVEEKEPAQEPIKAVNLSAWLDD